MDVDVDYILSIVVIQFQAKPCKTYMLKIIAVIIIESKYNKILEMKKYKMSKMRLYKLTATGNFICSEACLIWQILLIQLVDLFGVFLL